MSHDGANILIASLIFATWTALFACGQQPAVPAPPAHLQCETKQSIDCFLAVPAGSFWMGAQSTSPDQPAYDPLARPDEGPPRRMEVDSFWIHRNEVRAAQVAACIEAGACAADDSATGGFSNLGVHERSHHAANSISWQGAVDTCRWLGGRLPTETEWEYAARGDTGRRYPWGDNARCVGADPSRAGGFQHGDDVVETSCTRMGTTAPADLRLRSPFGLLGMAGNVWEWTQDAVPPVEGQDAETTSVRVQRGGGWTSTDPTEFRVAARGRMRADAKLHDVGFRCVWGRTR